MTKPLSIETLTSVLPEVAPELEAVHDDTTVGFYRFKSGPYQGITYTYADIRVREVGDRLELSFTHVIMQDPEGNQPLTAEDEDVFKDTIGNLLVKIIDASFNKTASDDA